MKPHLQLSLGMLLCLCMSTSAATTYYVATNGTDAANNSGTSWPTAFLTISNAVTKAQDNDAIVISNGVYTLGTKLVLDKALIIAGTNGATHTIINGNGKYGGFYITGAATLSGVTVTNCNGVDSWIDGGGICIENAGARVANCIVSGCTVTNTNRKGGGVFMSAGIVSNCVIRGNEIRGTTVSSRGGGVNMSGGCMVDCEIAFNQAKYDAGGVFLSGASRMIRCQVYTNYSETSGGGVRAYYFNGFVQDCGISNNYSKVSGGGISGGVISNCVIVGNTASGNGGGLYMTEAAGYSMIATSCIISNNHAGGIGGGGYVQTAGAQVIDCAIVGNTAINQSGGFHCNGTMNALFRNCLIASNSSSNPNTACGLTAGGGARVESCTIVGNQKDFGLKISDTSYVTNTIIASNSVNYAADISGLANNFFYSCCPSKELPASQGNINVAPGLVDVANGDFHLAPDSPCLNKGVNQTWMSEALDLGGGYRLDKRYSKVDMGCFERQLDFNGCTVLVIR